MNRGIAPLLVLCAAGAVGCGGGAPLLHPAHVPAAGEVNVGAGVSGHFVLGPAGDSLDDAQEVSRTGFPPDDVNRRTYVEGILVESLTSPGVAPYVGARAGIGYDLEGGLAYTGRAVRVDGRYALEWDDVALSLGIGGSRVLIRPGSDSSIGRRSDGGIVGLDTRDVSGWGVDVPILVGWRSDGDVVRFWGGPRGGAELVQGNVAILTSPDATDGLTGPLDGERFYVGGVLGMAVGVSPFFVAIEVDAYFQRFSGTLELNDSAGNLTGLDEEVSGLSVTPSGALIAEF